MIDAKALERTDIRLALASTENLRCDKCKQMQSYNDIWLTEFDDILDGVISANTILCDECYTKKQRDSKL